MASWTLIGYTFTAAVGGVLASKLGPRIVLTMGLAVTAIGMIMTAVATGLLSASFGRLVTGMGNGMILVPSIALMAAWFNVRQVGFASSIVPAGSSLAMVLAGPLVPQLIDAGGSDGWRLAWYFFAAVTVLLTVLNLVLMRDEPSQPMRGRGVLYGRRASGAEARREATGKELVGILRTWYAWHLGIIYFLCGVGFLTYFTFFQKRLTNDLDYSSEAAGSLFLVVGVAGLVGGFFWGAVSNRIGRRLTMAITMALGAAAALMFAWAPNVLVLVLSAVFLGSTGVVIPGLMGAACGDRFGTVLASASLGFITVLVGVGQSVGPYIGGILADAFGSLGPAYLLAAGVYIVGAAGALLLLERRRGRAAVRAARPDPAPSSLEL